MNKLEIEVYSQATNAAVVRLPTRKFPGLVLQGDSLFALYGRLEDLVRRLARAEDREPVAEAEEILSQIASYLEHYESVLEEHGIALPYHRGPSPEN